MAEGNIQNSPCFKRQEQRSNYITFPPPRVSINQRRDPRIIIKGLLGGESFKGGGGGDYFVPCWSR